MSTLGDLMIRVGATIDGFSDAMRDVVSQASDAADAVADKLESVGDVGKKLAVLGASLTTAITIPLEEMARRSLDVAGTFEQTRIAFQSLMGSSAEADVELKQLYDFAAKTPFEIPQVLDGARKLMALGFAASDIVPILRVVGDQAAALGMGGVGMDRILMNLGKIEAQGKITGHELRNLGEDDVPALASIALARHESKGEAFKDVSAGKVDSEEAINAILRGMQLRTGGLMESQMQSFQTQMSNLKDQITLTAAAIGNALLPVGKVLVNWAQEAITGVKELAVWFGQLPAPIQASAIALVALAAAAGPALTAIGGLGFLLPNVMGGLAALAKFGSLIGVAVTGVVEYITTLGAMVTEYGIAATASFAFGDSLVAAGAALLGWPALIAVAIGALAALATWVYSHWEGVKAFLHQVFDGLGEAWSASIGVAVNWLSNTLGFTASDLIRIWTVFKGAFLEIWDAIGSFLHTVIDGFKSDIQGLVKLLEKIPGMQKVFSAGDAFTKADHDSSERSEMSDIGKRLRVGADNTPFSLTDKYQADLEKHNTKLKEAVELLANFKKGYEDGIVSEKDFKQAQANVDFIRNDVPKREPKSADGKTKLDRNALDGLSGEHAHEEATVALQRAQIEHDYAMNKPGANGTLGMSSEEVAEQEIAAAEKRKAALDKLASDELKSTLATIDQKLKLYKDDQAGHQKLIEAKTAAEDKFKAAVQKTSFDVETVKKQANDRILQDDLKSIEEDLKAQQKAYEESLKTLDLLVQAYDERSKAKQKQAQFDAQLEDKRLQFELETGQLSKQQYLQLKQEQYDAAYVMEVQAIEEERDLIESMFSQKLDEAQTPKQKEQVMADRQKRIGRLDSREQDVENKHTGQQQDTGIAKERDRIGTMDKNFFTPFENGFSKGISNMVKGIQTFKQAWSSMATGMLSQWIDHVAQMVSQWVTAKLRELVVHATTNQAKVASDQVAAAQSKGISITQHLHEAMLAAKLAAAKTWAAISGIPVIGPILAPVAAAAAFAGVLAISAEGGGVLPNHNTFGFLHPQEMVLPKGISVGLQNLIASGGLSNASSIMNQAQGGSMSSTALQMMRNTAAAGDVSHTHNWGGITVHNTAKDPINEDKVFNLMQGAMRKRNLQMA